MKRERYSIFKVFIASPGDVLPERRMAFQVVEDVNRILANINKPYRLEVRAWEGHVHPDLGLPEEVILKQIPIEECDHFIGIFWRRFGTPTGRRRPQDGKPYLSGTEEEIEKAIQARKSNPENRPIIMLYRKIDPLPREMTEEDHCQYASVIDYFKKFEPGGEHPALIIRFSGSEFVSLLRDHLLRAITGVEDQNQAWGRFGPSGRRTPQQSQDEDPQSRWLRQVGLTDNPFRYNVAGFERDKLPGYYVSFGGFRIRELVRQTGPIIVFSDRGGGKSALRVMIASRCYPENCDSDSLCVELDQAEFKHTISLVDQGLEGLKASHYVQAIVQMALDCLQRRSTQLRSYGATKPSAVAGSALPDTSKMYRQGMEYLLHKLGKTHPRYEEALTYQHRLLQNVDRAGRYGESSEQKSELFQILDQLDQLALSALHTEFGILCKESASSVTTTANDLGTGIESNLAELQRLICIPPDELGARENELRACHWLKILASTAKEFGFHRVLCLVDGVDEVPAVQDSPDRMAQLLAPVMIPALRENRGVAFRYFLPTLLRPIFEKQREQFRLDRVSMEKIIEWSESDLKRLIRQRLIFFSRDQVAPYWALGELCESTNDFAEAIDGRLAELATGNPRAAIWLACRLLEVHCRVDEPPRLIRPVSWEEVELEWHRDGRRRFVGNAAQTAGPWISGNRVFYMDREMTLSPLSHRLLSRLLQTRGEVCTRADLVKAGWPSENPAYVTDRAVNEAMGRLRKQLEQEGGDPNWVETIRARGYRFKG
jgi:hypothetical protein